MSAYHDHLLAEVHERLGYRRLSRPWAQSEIALGLLATIAGLLLGIASVVQPFAEIPWHFAALGALLFVLGGYLTLAGHRSLLYQSHNRQIALLIEEIRRALSDTQVSPPRR